MKDTDIDSAVEKLFGPYKLRPKVVMKEEPAAFVVPDKQDKISPPPESEFDHIKKLTASMLKQLSKAIKSKKWGEKLYYSHKFLQIAMSISKLVIERKQADHSGGIDNE